MGKECKKNSKIKRFDARKHTHQMLYCVVNRLIVCCKFLFSACDVCSLVVTKHQKDCKILHYNFLEISDKRTIKNVPKIKRCDAKIIKNYHKLFASNEIKKW